MTDVHVAYTKWGGAAHWTFDARRLGRDQHGVWLGAPAGLRIARPGAELILDAPHVLLLPDAEPWTATFYRRTPSSQLAYEVYIDMSTPPEWTDETVTMVDLDLDVVRYWDGQVELLDEDEFAEHQAALGYPREIVALAERSSAECQASLARGGEPFATAYRDWLARL
jgi:hypothetical protein